MIAIISFSNTLENTESAWIKTYRDMEVLLSWHRLDKVWGDTVYKTHSFFFFSMQQYLTSKKYIAKAHFFLSIPQCPPNLQRTCLNFDEWPSMRALRIKKFPKPKCDLQQGSMEQLPACQRSQLLIILEENQEWVHIPIQSGPIMLVSCLCPLHLLSCKTWALF